MKKKNQSDVLMLLQRFQKAVLQKKPKYDQMINDVRMMRFKIRPLQGDLSTVDFQDRELVEIIWSLGKMDEFFHIQYPKLPKKHRQTFYTYFDSLQRKFQEDLNRLSLKKKEIAPASSALEMEIFKERSSKRRTN